MRDQKEIAARTLADVVGLVAIAELNGFVDTSGRARWDRCAEAACGWVSVAANTQDRGGVRVPLEVQRSTSTVGLPRESKIW